MALDLIFESLQVAQFEHLESLFGESGMSSISRDQLATRLQSKHFWQFAVHLQSDNVTAEDRLPVGVIFGRQVEDEVEIDDLIVRKNFRRKGIATALLKYALAQAWRAGGRTVFLEVRLSNTSAQHLYYSMGFSVIGQRRAYYHSPTEDALILSLVLCAPDMVQK